MEKKRPTPPKPKMIREGEQPPKRKVGKTKLSKKGLEAQKLILSEIEKSLKGLEDFFIKYCKDNQTRAVNIEVIKAAHKVWIAGLKKGSGIK